MNETMMTEAATTTEGAASPAAVQPEAQAPAPATPSATEQAQQPAQQPKPEGPPAEYADFTFGEGQALDPAIVADIKAAAKDAGMTQAQAQKVAELAVKRVEAERSRQSDALTQARTQWADAARADKEYGGQNLEASLGYAKKALDAYGSPELKALLNETGLGNHPELIRAFVRAGKAISEDRIITGGRQAPPPADPAKRLFPNQA